MTTRDPGADAGPAAAGTPSPVLLRFFDGLVRRSFGELRLGGDAVTAYVGALLARFARTEALHRIRDGAGRRVDSLAGLLLEAARAWDFDAPDFDPFRERVVRQHVGDYALFMTGLFREHVERRAGTGFYLREGQRAYRAVADFERAALRGQAPLFAALAEDFERYAGALTYLRRVHLPGIDAPPALRPFLRLLPGLPG
jgi:hypothetical protein